MYSCVWGRTVSFATPHGAQEGRGHWLPASRDYASLAPATLLCFCQTFEADSPPLLALKLSRLPVCHLLISFSGSRWSELSRVEYTPLSFHHQYSLQQATHMDELWAIQCLEWSGTESQLSAYDP